MVNCMNVLQFLFVLSLDVVVYYLIRKSSLMAFKWHHFYVTKVTIIQDISKTKNALLPYYEHLF